MIRWGILVSAVSVGDIWKQDIATPALGCGDNLLALWKVPGNAVLQTVCLLPAGARKDLPLHEYCWLPDIFYVPLKYWDMSHSKGWEQGGETGVLPVFRKVRGFLLSGSASLLIVTVILVARLAHTVKVFAPKHGAWSIS